MATEVWGWHIADKRWQLLVRFANERTDLEWAIRDFGANYYPLESFERDTFFVTRGERYGRL